MSRLKPLSQCQDYAKDEPSHQQQMSPDEIRNALQGYRAVDDIADVPLNTHIRYFVRQSDGAELFRLGGFLYNKANADVYVTLSNGRQKWSVQVATARFFQKMTPAQEIEKMRLDYEQQLQAKDAVITKLKNHILKMRASNKKN